MKGLLIDTGANPPFIALAKKDLILSCRLYEQGPSLSKHFFTLIKNLLTEEDTNLSELFYIGIGIGPGSYTGTRIGVAVAQSISFGKNLPLIPFCSSASFSPIQEGPFAILLEGKNKNFHLLKGTRKGRFAHFSPTHGLFILEDLLGSLEKEATIVLREPPSTLEFPLPYQKAHLHLEPLVSDLWTKFQSNLCVQNQHIDILYLHHPG